MRGRPRLQINGAGTRYKAIFKVYAAGLYTESRLCTPEAVYRNTGAKRMHVVMLREVDSGGFGKILMQGMEANLPRDQLKHCIPGIVQLGEVFSAKKRMAAGETYTLEARPGSGSLPTGSSSPTHPHPPRCPRRPGVPLLVALERIEVDRVDHLVPCLCRSGGIRGQVGQGGRAPTAAGPPRRTAFSAGGDVVRRA